MYKKVLLLATLLFIFNTAVAAITDPVNTKTVTLSENSFNSFSLDFYQKINDKELDFEAFKYALKGYVNLKANNQLKNAQFLTIIDMGVSSNKERFFIVNMETQQIVYKSLVAHGKNSGGEFPSQFSNVVNSHKSSIGFFKTAETYSGKHGFSLRLDGLEYSNSNARKRAVVIHSAKYVSKDYINKNGRLGRSFGCPSLPAKDYKAIINNIKEGSCLFIYYPKKDYLKRSKLINSLQKAA